MRFESNEVVALLQQSGWSIERSVAITHVEQILKSEHVVPSRALIEFVRSFDGLTLTNGRTLIKFDAWSAVRDFDFKNLHFLTGFANEAMCPIGYASHSDIFLTDSARVVSVDLDWIVSNIAASLENFILAFLCGRSDLLETIWLTDEQRPAHMG